MQGSLFGVTGHFYRTIVTLRKTALSDYNNNMIYWCNMDIFSYL